MKTLKEIFFTTAFTLCTFVYASASSPLTIPLTGMNEVSAPSVETTSLVERTEHPLNYSTGTAYINFPLFNIKSGELELPITISTTTAGLKIGQESGPLGVGWDLNFGGYITRRIVGRPDSIGTYDNINLALAGNYDMVKRIFERNADGEYDRYDWRAGDMSGSFIMIGSDVLQMPDTGCNIEKTSSGFRITLLDGTVYNFGLPETTEYVYNCDVDDLYHGNEYTSAHSAWRPTSIISPDRCDTITFTYSDVPELTKWSSMRTSSFSLSTTSISQNVQNAVGSITGSHSPSSGYPGGHSHFSGRKVLSSIAWSGGHISTVSNQGLINRISIYDPNNNERRRIDFEYYNTVPQQYESEYSPQLISYTVTSEGETLDGATFQYNPIARPLNKDFFVYINNGAIEARIPSHLEFWPHSHNESGFYTTIVGDYVIDADGNHIRPTSGCPEYTYLVDPRESVLAITAAGVRENPAIQPYAPSTLGGVYSGALRSIQTVAGLKTEFEHEPAWYDADTADVGQRFIGLRLKSETITNLSTGTWVKHTLNYLDPHTSVPICFTDYDNFVSVSGAISSFTLGLTSTNNVSTGVTLLTSSRRPGRLMENAVVYYREVTDAVTGSGIDGSILTTYEYDTSDLNNEAEYGLGLRINSHSDWKYNGTFITGLDNPSSPYAQAVSNVIQPSYIKQYFPEHFYERVPLKKTTEWRSEGASLDTLRVTEHFNSYDHLTEHCLGFYCDPLVRKISGNGQESGLGYSSLADFNYFPVKAYSARMYCDSTIVREYDSRGTCRKTVKRFAYQDHGTDCPQGTHSLLSKESTSCGDDTYTQLYTYASTYNQSTVPLDIIMRRPALPISTVISHGDCTVSQHNMYNYFTGRYKIAKRAIRHHDVTIDSIAFTAYDTHGNPTSISKNGEMTYSYTWDNYHHPLTINVGGLLTSSYTYIPLVGCSSETTPAGTRIGHKYLGPRLIADSIAGDLIARYEYRLPDRFSLGHVKTTKIATGNVGPSITKYIDASGQELVDAVSPFGTAVGYANCVQLDALGRQLAAYMPVPIRGDVDPTDPNTLMTAANSFYNDAAPMSTLTYSHSSDARPVRARLTGQDYIGHESTTQYLFNKGTSGELSCRRYSATYSTLSFLGYYADGQLDVTHNTDADGRVSLVFTDWRGRKIMTRGCIVENGSNKYVDTYYIYDDADNLVMVLPPKASKKFNLNGYTWRSNTNTTLRDSVYRYEYDEALRLITKKMPGCEEFRYWYDHSHHPVFTQDANQRQRGVVSFDICDACGRSAISGECAYTENLIESISNVEVIASRSTSSSPLLGYSVNITLPSPTVYVASFYDDYSFLTVNAFSTIAQKIASANINPSRANNMGLLTGTYTRVLYLPDVNVQSVGGISDYITSAFYYDDRERTVKSVSLDPQGGFNVTNKTLSNTDMPLSMTITRTPNSGSAEVATFNYTYDGFDRQKNVTLTRNGVTTLLETTNYNDIGQISSLKFGNSCFIGYAYNTAGAIKSISSGRDGGANSFVQSLQYANGPTPSYSGNIGSMSWRGSDGTLRTYRYGYDGLNRLTSALYSESGRSGSYTTTGTPNYNTSYVYDYNSNPIRITRNGVTDILSTQSSTGISFGKVDDLKLTYSGNNLMKVYDTADDIVYVGASDFNDGANNSNEYSYDKMGNVTKDDNRGITSISYNSIGLPAKIYFNNGSYIMNFYDASGALVRRRTYNGTLSTDEDRIGIYSFRNNLLDKIDIPNGFIKDNHFYYYVKDYQGNIRQVKDANGNVLQDNHYYPYGMLMGESSDIISANQTGYWNNGASNSLRFCGNELLTTNNSNIYDFIARLYDNQTTIFWAQDLLKEKNYESSPYLYCAANPVMFTDKNGMDSIFINSKGYITNIIRDKRTEHTIQIIDKDGNYGKSLNFSRKAFENSYKWKHNAYHDLRTKEGDDSKESVLVEDISFIRLRGDKVSLDIFTFLSNNTKVEWSLIATGIKGKKGLNFLMTSHLEANEIGCREIINNQLIYGYTVRAFYHNHPSGSISKKGLLLDDGDKGFATSFFSIFKSSRPQMYIYPNGGLFHLVLMNFFRMSIALPLPEPNWTCKNL